MARILLCAAGTRGDIQPFIALAKGLQAAGHEPALCTPSGFAPFIERHKVRYLPMDNTQLELAEAILKAPTGSQKRQLFKQFGPALRRAVADEWAAAQVLRPELLVYHPKCLGSHHIAEKLGVPEAMLLPLPLTPTRAFPAPFIPANDLGGVLNRFTYRLLSLANVAWAGVTNGLRTSSLGLPPLSRFADPLRRSDGAPVPVVYPYSRHVVPVPSDFPAHVHVTGYLFLDEGAAWSPPPRLEAFLCDGAPPVYVGFGSMADGAPEERARTVFRALELAGKRGVLASGWGGLSAAEAPAHVLMLDSVPHDWLFPRVSAVVHHGGAGTTAAGLRAGRPTVICPFLADQPFWGNVIHRAGAGPQPIPKYRLTAEALAAALAVTDQADVRARAESLGAQIRSEDGLGATVHLLTEEVLRGRSQTRLT